MNLDEIKPWLATCGSCDAGLPMSCTCPPGDHRAVMARLVAEVELLQAEVDRERGKVGDLVRQLNGPDACPNCAPGYDCERGVYTPTDITRGQGEVWPAGASLPAGPPLPRRTPGESLKPCGWMGIEPMTDPALEDRAEGEQP